MKRNSWRGREKHARSNRRQTYNAQPYRMRHHWSYTERQVYDREERQNSQNPGTSQTEFPSTSSTICQSSPAPELPGFYYDPVKNRYFRLLPGHNNCNPLTKESIQHREMECQRLRLLEEEKKCIKKTSRCGLNSSIILRKRQLGLFSSINYCRLIHELKVNCMQRRKLEIESPDSTVSGNNYFKLIAADTAYERIFTVNDVEHGGCKYGIINLSGLGKDSLTVEMYDNLYFTNRKVLFCPLFKITIDPFCLIAVKIAILQIRVFLIRIVCIASLISLTVSIKLCLMGVAETLGCASLLPASLFSNSNTGEIFSIDVRQRTHKGQRWKAIRLFHHSAVTSVNVLKNEHYLMAADMEGKVKLWDLRKLKCVKEYKGHHNEHTILPLHISEEEGFLTAVGQDCYTRIWGLQDARLLRTIPSPHPSSTDSIPSVVFSSRLGGTRGVPGLLMAVRQDLYYFSYKSDDPYCLGTKDMDHPILLSD
ncbi:hypothetical protein JD844_021347 [Phrynosoma platyrhinos]|uniref:DDB1- and CUL4-associated factor 4 n=1 Tax=Phrynosoma platyrhinos TaxID=52577 RepID=A0ABQ7STK2_PHRPL|nr:hypothetical protein JD844_021347 [Phrynosoma platyrhinos]